MPHPIGSVLRDLKNSCRISLSASIKLQGASGALSDGCFEFLTPERKKLDATRSLRAYGPIFAAVPEGLHLMTDKLSDDPVSHFSGYVEEFHSHYQDRCEFQERLEIWHPLLDKYAVPGGRSVDMGCGTGIFSFHLAEKGGQVIGIDGAPDMIKFCESQRAQRGLPNIQFMQARLPAVDERALDNADLVISSSVVEYVEDLDVTLGLFSRLLRPGGTLILSMPNTLCINRIYERVKYRFRGEPHIYRYIRHFTTPTALAKRVRRLGLRIEDVCYYTHYTRLARLTRKLGLPSALTEDLFVAVFRKS
jgi:2-polyprenyl-3-methyl-5-hydroxy-6-metoxy-1,4-benzoquinol methylase